MVHLYYKTSTSKQLSDTVDAFESCEFIDISNTKSLKYDEIYLVEIDKIEKALLLHIKNLLASKTESLIYFFINDSHNLMLFQLASMLNVKSIITPKHDTSKIISNIKTELLKNKNAQIQNSIAKSIIKDQCFMLFDSNGLKFASNKLYDEFKCTDLEMVKSRICLELDLAALLKEDISQQKSFNFTGSTQAYNIRSSTSSYNDNKFIYIENISQDAMQLSSGVNFIKNRIYFIEILKEKILETSISKSLFSIITIQIENMSNLRLYWSEYEIEMSIRDLLLQVEIEIDSSTLLAQYDNNLYLTLFEGLDFESTKQKASTIQAKISTYTSKQKIKPIIGLYAFDINALELNTVLKTISDIARESISIKDIEAQKLYRVIDISNELDDARAIDILLQATFTNKTPIKLLNIYKGLCINTSSNIMKKTDQEVYVTYEQLQGTVMNFEKETVIQSSSFTKDIIADVKYIDSKRRLALLKNFRFVQGSANGRRYSRVTCSQRTPISIVHQKGTLSGEVLDISMNSIAIKTRLYPNIDSLKMMQVSLKFTLPVTSSEEGYLKLTLTAEVIFTMCDEEFCKVVVNLDEDQVHEAILMEYVYDRQKEIIVELKKQSTMLN
ncbi:PilZ domain-containing protein [Sulfurimonas sp.]|uniref:PilZ domain-containing protein n=1 Tax=Sulfurimonas sp. TaxID=2022749 RepID=UPI0035674FBF